MRLTELVTPLKPLEAMAQGKLLLASDVGGHHELITDKQNGYLFKADDIDNLVIKIREVLTEKSHWPEVISEGRRFVEEVRNWRNSVANYVGLYQELTGKKVSE